MELKTEQSRCRSRCSRWTR